MALIDFISKLKQKGNNSLFELIIKPLLKRKPEDMSVDIFLDTMFEADSTSIIKYQAKEAFLLPGEMYRHFPKRKVRLKSKLIPKNTRLIIRHNTKVPNIYHVEFQITKSNESIYLLDKKEFISIRSYLKEI